MLKNLKYNFDYKDKPDDIPDIFKNPLPILGDIEAVKMKAASNKFEICNKLEY